MFLYLKNTGGREFYCNFASISFFYIQTKDDGEANEGLVVLSTGSEQRSTLDKESSQIFLDAFGDYYKVGSNGRYIPRC